MVTRVLIVYQSKTGNTEAMAKAVAAGVSREGLEVSVKRLEETNVDDLLEPAGIIIGSPTYFAGTTAEVKRLIDESIKHFGRLDGKAGAAFTSSGDLGGGNETALLDILRAFLVHGMVVQGYTSGGHYGPVSIGAPDKERQEVCEAFGAKFAKLVKRLAVSA